MQVTGARNSVGKIRFVFEDLEDEESKEKLSVELEPLRLGWDLEVIQEIGLPSAPLKIVGKGPDGPQVFPNTEDGTYKLRDLEGNALQAAAMIFFALGKDQRFTFATEAAIRRKAPAKFWASIYNELRESPISGRDFGRLLKAISDGSGVSNDDVDKARTAFLLGKEESPNGSSSDSPLKSSEPSSTEAP